MFLAVRTVFLGTVPCKWFPLMVFLAWHMPRLPPPPEKRQHMFKMVSDESCSFGKIGPHKGVRAGQAGYYRKDRIGNEVWSGLQPYKYAVR